MEDLASCCTQVSLGRNSTADTGSHRQARRSAALNCRGDFGTGSAGSMQKGLQAARREAPNSLRQGAGNDKLLIDS